MKHAAFTRAGGGAVVGSRKHPFLVEVFAKGEIETAVGMPGEAG